VHQCGGKHVDEARAAYARAGVTAEIQPFIADVAARYAEADLVICRAGAITAAELCVAGVPSILVPFIASTTDHQRTNAEFLAQHGAALHLPQSGLTAEALARALRGLSRPRLLEMAQQARALGKPQAAATVADAIEHIAKASPSRHGAAA
jgi:UDP-N-acetylglucosamine--N-acetylmuramyl-(pentapeptide) pyrophosphoryl-undecaprenol N-acetylglucosamine transferase